MASTAQIQLLIFAVRDVALALAFYRGAFGWSQSVDVPVYAELQTPGGLRLGLYQAEAFARNTGCLPQPVPPGSLSGAELYLYSQSVEEEVTRALSAGARLLSPLSPRPWGDEAAYLADPDGNVVVLARPASAP